MSGHQSAMPSANSHVTLYHPITKTNVTWKIGLGSTVNWFDDQRVETHFTVTWWICIPKLDGLPYSMVITIYTKNPPLQKIKLGFLLRIWLLNLVCFPILHFELPRSLSFWLLSYVHKIKIITYLRQNKNNGCGGATL